MKTTTHYEVFIDGKVDGSWKSKEEAKAYMDKHHSGVAYEIKTRECYPGTCPDSLTLPDGTKIY